MKIHKLLRHIIRCVDKFVILIKEEKNQYNEITDINHFQIKMKIRKQSNGRRYKVFLNYD